MEAVVVGTRGVDFTDKDGNRVKMTKYFLNLPAENVEGYEVGSVAWNEIKNGAPPVIAIGEIIEVEYNRYGRLVMVPARAGK